MNIDFEKLWCESPHSGVLFFECSIREEENRSSKVLSFDFQLWHRSSRSSGEAQFLSELHLDKRTEIPSEFQAKRQRLLRLVWPYTQEQLETIEGHLEQESPFFEIRGKLLVQSIYAASPSGPARSYLQWEDFYNPQASSNVIYAELQRTQWAVLVNKLGFRPRVLRAVSLLVTPGFKRATECIRDAWKAHRTNEHDKVLQLCFVAFESLGFNLYGTADMHRGDLLKQILRTADQQVVNQIGELFKSFQNFLNLGRHERGQQVDLSAAESKLAIINTELLLSYLEGYFSRV